MVCFENALSEPCDIYTGVPQGSILGPLLFVTFVNDQPDSILQSHVLMYADDTVIFYASKKVSEIERVLNSQLDNLHKWLLENNLFLNKEKTECVLFGSSPRLCKVQNFSIILGNQALRHVVEFKYLGIVMDGSLTWKSHTANLFSKVSKRIGILRRIRNDITLSAADMVYKSFILPLIIATQYGHAATKVMLIDWSDCKIVLQRRFMNPIAAKLL